MRLYTDSLLLINNYNLICLSLRHSKKIQLFSAIFENSLDGPTCVLQGLVYSLQGPSIPDMCDRLRVSEQGLAMVFSVTSVVGMTLSIVTGMAVDR